MGRALALLIAHLLLQHPPGNPHASQQFSTTCVARNIGVITVDDKTKESHEDESWVVDCRIEREGKVIWSGALTLASRASFRDAMDAVDDFRKVKAPKIARAYKG